MCLTKQLGVPAKTSGVGYKVLIDRHRMSLESLADHHFWDLKGWNTAEGDEVEAGFHIFVKMSDAMRLYEEMTNHDYFPAFPYFVYEVAYQEAFLEGVGDGFGGELAQVIVAKRVRILEQVTPTSQETT